MDVTGLIIPAREKLERVTVLAVTPDVFAPARLGPVELRNRTVKAATFEGRAPHGQVTDALIDYHLAVARGGIGLTTVAYLAVAPEGRTHREQIVVGEDDPRRAGPADRRDPRDRRQDRRTGGPRRPGRQRPLQRRPRAEREPDAEPAVDADDRLRVSEEDLTRITKAYVATARLLVRAGFDVLELHMAHSYLISSFLAPGLNRRNGPVGRLAREPRPARPPGGARGARRGRLGRSR